MCGPVYTVSEANMHVFVLTELNRKCVSRSEKEKGRERHVHDVTYSAVSTYTDKRSVQPDEENNTTDTKHKIQNMEYRI